jgi:transposase InsO family protein
VILDLITAATAQGLPEQRACEVLGLSPRTVQRWRQPAVPTPVAAPRPRPYNALTRAEAAAVVSVIRSSPHADQSCRELALTLAQKAEPIAVSHVTIWRYQVALGCHGPRGRQLSRRHTPAPTTDWVTGPNQLWDWDITWLRTWQRHEFLYLYSLLDHFSRKIVAWRVSEFLNSSEVQALWDRGLIHEGLLDQPCERWPQSLSDRGAQMRSYSTRQYFRKLGVDQLFGRPRQPNDNPRMEAHFGTVKTHPAYPGFFADVPAAVAYFTVFYDWYNNVHPLTTLNMLTPHQVHSGQAAALLAARQACNEQALAMRLTVSHDPFTVEELIAEPLPDVSDWPVYSFTWAGPESGSAKQATPFA